MNALTNKKGLERNIKLLYADYFLSNLAFFLPVLSIYFQGIVNSVTAVTLIFTIMAVTSIIFELPTGAFADLFGRKKTLVLSGLLTVVSFVLLAFSHNFAMLIVFAILFSFKNALSSGTQEAVYYDSIKLLGREKEYKKIIGRATIFFQIGALLGAVAGGYMAAIYLQLPFLLSIPVACIAFILRLLITDPPYRKPKHRNLFIHSRNAIMELIEKKQLLLLVCFGVIVFGLGEALYHLSQIFFKFAGLQIVLFGVVAAIGSGIGMLGAFSSHYVSKKIGDKATLILTFILYGAFMIFASILLGYTGIILIVAVSLFTNIAGPIMGHLVNSRVSSHNRATMLSINNLLYSLGYGVFAPFLGYLADKQDIALSFKIGGIIIVLSVVLLTFLRVKK